MIYYSLAVGTVNDDRVGWFAFCITAIHHRIH